MDPGAGTGILTVAFVDRLLKEKPDKLLCPFYKNMHSVHNVHIESISTIDEISRICYI